MPAGQVWLHGRSVSSRFSSGQGSLSLSAPVGQTSTHAPQNLHAASCMVDLPLVLTVALMPRLMKPMAPQEFLAAIREVVASHGHGGLAVPQAPLRDAAELDRRHDELLSTKLAHKVEELQDQRQALAASERRFRTLVQTVPDILFTLDPATLAVTFVSPVVQAHLGYAAAELVGGPERWQPLIHEDDRQRVEREVRSGLEAGGELRVEARLQRRDDGGWRWFEARMTAEAEDDGRVVAIHGVVRDIHRRRSAEESLRESRERLRLALEAAIAGTWAWDVDSRILWWDTRVGEMLGLPMPPRGLRLEQALDAVHPADRDYVREGLRRSLEEGSSYDHEFRAQHPDGTVRVVGSRGEMQRDPNGRPLRMTGLCWDLTERRELEEQARRHTERLNTSLVQTIDAIARVVEKRDPYTAGHQQRVADLAVAIAEEMALDADTVAGIHLGGLIHDIGKIYVPAEILNRPGKLSDTEFNIIKAHPETGYDVIKDVELPWPVARIIAEHHERLDGSGYPRGLTGEAICTEARILAVADVVEAITSHRPYRPGLGLDVALHEISARAGTAYDADAVAACLRIIRDQGYRLGDGMTTGMGLS